MKSEHSPIKVVLSWSSGKDSAWTLYKLKQDPRYQVVGLVTTFNQQAERVAMHAVRNRLVKQQAEQLGLPLRLIPLPYPCSNEQYLQAMNEYLLELVSHEIHCIAFGDLFLEDVRDYRIQLLKDSPVDPLFPLWKIDTQQLAKQILVSGTRAILTCVDPNVMPAHFCGREYDQALLQELPSGVDPCGENGEFHTFVYHSPLFKRAISIDIGDTVKRDGFIFTDLV